MNLNKFSIYDFHNHQKWWMSLILIIIFSISLSSTVNAQKKVKIFLMAGQSNMQGHGDDRLNKLLCAMGHYDIPDDPDGCFQSISDEQERVYEAMQSITYQDSYSLGNYLVSKEIVQNELIDDRLYNPLDKVQIINFNYTRNDGVRSDPGIWSGPLKIGFGFTNNGESFGPELLFGHRMAQYIDEDIVLVKVAEGGTDLYEKWRSPSMEARLGVSDETSNYPLLALHLNDVVTNLGSYFPKYDGVEVEIEVAGFLWFQGFNDAVNNTFAEAYEQNLRDFLGDLRNDLNMPEIPIVITQTNNSGTGGIVVQAAQQTVADQIGNAATFTTQELSGYFHFNSGAYLVIGDHMGLKMLELLETGDTNSSPAAPTALEATSLSNAVALSWEDPANNETAFRIERSLYANSGFVEIATISPNTRSYVDKELPRNTYFYRVSAVNNAGSSEYASVSFDLDKFVLSPWLNADIGEPAVSGSANDLNGTFTLEGAGKEIHEDTDEFHYVYQKVSGNHEIIARVNSLSASADNALAGVMIRTILSNNSAHGTVGFNNKAEIKWESRDHDGGGTFQQQQPTVAQWVKLVNIDGVISSYTSEDGSNWEEFVQREINIWNNYYIGLLVNSSDTNELATGVFSEVIVRSVGTGVVLPASPSSLSTSTLSTERIKLNWIDNSDNETGFKVERSLNAETGFEEIASLSADITTYEDAGLEAATTYYYRVFAYNEAGVSDYSEVSSAQTEALSTELPSPWERIDVGEPAISGSASYEEGSYIVIGSGNDIWNDSDEFHYVYQPVVGDVEITARVNSVSNSDSWAKAGVMIRESLDANSKHAMMIVTPSMGTEFQRRLTTGEGSVSTSGAIDSAPAWFKLSKIGSEFSAYHSADGVNWILVETDTIAMKESFFIGLAVTSHNVGEVCTANISDVVVNSVIIPIPEAPSSLSATTVSTESITLNWADNSDNEDGFKIERSLNSDTGFEEIASLSADITTYEDAGLVAATTYYYRVFAYNEAGVSDYSEISSAQTEALSTELPSPWERIDIGEPAISGSASYEEGSFIVTGSGLEIYNRSDQFYYVHQGPLVNGEIIARVDLSNALGGSQAGIMIRQGLYNSSPHVALLLDPNYLATYKTRGHDGGTTVNNKFETFPVQWLKLVKEGIWLSSYVSSDGQAWELVQEKDFSNMGSGCYFGLAVTSNDITATTTGVFSNVSVNSLATAPESPSSLSTTTVSTESIALNWVDNSDNEDGFKVERSLNSDTGFEEIASLSADITNYEDAGLVAATTYYYRVLAFNDAGNSDYIATHATTPDLAPITPSFLTATAVSAEIITLNWSDNSDNETGFKLERSLNAETGFEEIASLSADITTYEDAGLEAATTYYFRVLAYNDAGASTYSQVSSAQTKSTSTNDELPFPWKNNDIGNPSIAGGVELESDGFLVSGSGQIDQELDNFQFVYRTLIGDGEIIARVSALSATPGMEIAGVMMRYSLESSSPHTTLAVTNDGKYVFRARDDDEETQQWEQIVSYNPQWVRLVRANGNITSYYSEDGTNWIAFRNVGSNNWYYGRNLYIGIAVSSDNEGSVCQASFDHVFFDQVLPEPQAPVNLIADSYSSSRIMLSWNYEFDDAQLFSIERSIYPDKEFEQITTEPATNYEDVDVLPSTNYYYKVRSVNENGYSLASTNVAGATTLDGNTQPPVPWEYSAIGLPDDSEGVVYSHGRFAIKGTSDDMIGETDQMNFVYQPMTGNGEIIARFNESTEGLTNGLMIREHQGESAKHILIGKNYLGIIIQTRKEEGALVERYIYPFTDAEHAWIKVIRSGDEINITYSNDNVKYRPLTDETISLENNVYIGLAVCGGNEQGNAGIFENVRVSPAATALVPQALTVNAISSSAVSIDWEYGSSSWGVDFSIERSLNADAGFEQIASVEKISYFTDSELNPETAYFYRIKALKDSEESEYSEVGQAITGNSPPLPFPWKNADVGEPIKTGYASYKNDTFTLSGAGRGIADRKDEFHYVYRPFNRNGELICKVNTVSQEAQSSQAGLMVRESLSGTETRMFYISATTDVNAEIEARSRDNVSGGTHAGGQRSEETFPFWLKLVKDGEYFLGYYSTDNISWIQVYERIVPLGEEVYAGLFVNSKNESIASTASISNVTFTEVATPATPRELEVAVNDESSEVSLNWKDYAKGESGFIVERSTDADTGFETNAVLRENTSTFTDTDAPLTTCFYRVQSFDDFGSSNYSNTAEIYLGTVPEPWDNMGVGHTLSSDTVVYKNGIFTINEQGAGIEGSSDQFRFLFQDVLGDGEIIVNVNDLISADPSAKAGLMIRESLDPDSKMIAFGLKGENSDFFIQERATKGVNSTEQTIGIATNPVWLKLSRVGDVFTASSSLDNISWNEVSQTALVFKDKTYFGMMASNGSSNDNVSGIFEQPVINRFNMGIPVLNLSRRAGDYDRLNAGNTIHVMANADTVNRKNTFTGMQGKSIGVELANELASTNSTISFKFIPDTLDQTVNLLETDNIVVRLNQDRISTIINGQEFSSDMPISFVVCNHVVLRFSYHEIAFYVNGEWQQLSNDSFFTTNGLSLGEYRGQTWDVKVYDGLLTDSELEEISQLCVPSVDASEFSPYGEEYTHAICGSYKCLWAKEDVDLMQEGFLYHLYSEDKTYEYYTFRAGMYVHDDLEGTLEYGTAQNWLVEDEEDFNGTFSNPTTSDRYGAHESFHGYQGFDPNSHYPDAKWFFEATANWGASFHWGDVPNSGITGITLYPHYPMLKYGTYSVPDGNRDYANYIFFSFITRFVSTPFFIGKIYNHDFGEDNILMGIRDVLAEEGHDFGSVFIDYAARTTVWDYEDGSGPVWKEVEDVSIELWRTRGYVDFNHKFTHIMDESGTNGVMTSITDEFKPGVYSWNAFKIESTAEATYSVKLRGMNDNPEGTHFKARIIKGAEGSYEYFDMPVSNAVAFGEAEAQINISTQLGEELYLIVASTPDVLADPLTPRYDYEYSIEPVETVYENMLVKSNVSSNQEHNSVAEEVFVYPTNTNGQFVVEFGEDHLETKRVIMYNSLGKRVPFVHENKGQNVVVDFEGPQGIYFVHVETGQVNQVFKVIKQ